MIRSVSTGQLGSPARCAGISAALTALIPPLMAEMGPLIACCQAAADARITPNQVASQPLELHRHPLDHVGDPQPTTVS